MKRFAALLSMALFALNGCTRPAHPSSAGQNASGVRGVLRVAIPQEPKTLNPLLASNSIDGFVWRLMFEPLVSADAHGTPVPILVTQVPGLQNGGVSADGLTITYHLRPHMLWSDGAPITANDVKFSWATVMNPDNNVASRHGYDDVASVQTPDALTAVAHLKKRFAPFVNTFFAESDQPYAIVPQHVLATFANINKIDFNAAPTVSDGPFKFVRWVHGDRVILTANDRFLFGKPKLAGIDVLTIANENTGVNLLRTGGIEFMFQASITTYPQLSGVPNVQIVMNSMNGYESLSFNARRAPMSDPRFRLAVAYAVDKARLVQTLTYGQEKVASEDLPDWMWAYNPDVKPYAHDVAKARALLARAGVKTPVSLVLVTDAANVTHKREAVVIQSMLHDVGINLEVKTYPGDLLYATAGAGGILNNGNFDLALWPWYGGLDPDDSSELACANRSPHGWNVEQYCNPEMDALQNTALTKYDQASRQAAYRRIQVLMARDNPMLFFWWQRQQEGIRSTFHGFAPNPVTESWNAWQWSVGAGR
ncbi:MAG: ABC transporter substrate-binding protein [Candidatus Baltobacteraceae bacterium]